jgi:uncharacterized protein
VTARSIVLGEGFELPPEYVTATGALLAVRGAGKTNGARVIAEGMFDAGLPFVGIDPVGSWYGLRSGRDGKPAGGLAIPIFGGRHGDVPIDRAEGEDVADIIVRENLSCLIDLSRFESEAAKKDFLLAFAKRLYEQNESARHLFLEEADDYIPQRPMRDEVRLLRAWENIVRRGRGRGLGMTMITQRSASINKNVLTQVETLFVMRTSGPQDRKAIEGWVRSSSVEVSAKDLATVPQLKSGEAFCWSPHFLGSVTRFRFRLSRTWDSGATPKAGEKRAATLAQVDVAKLTAELEGPPEEPAKEAGDEEWNEVVEVLRDKLAGAEGERDTLRDRLAQLEVRLRVEDGQIARLEKAAREIELAGLSVVEAARDLFIRLPHHGSLDSSPDLSPALGTQERKPASSNGKPSPTFPQGDHGCLACDYGRVVPCPLAPAPVEVKLPERGTLVHKGRRLAIQKGDRISLDDAGEVQVERTLRLGEAGAAAQLEERVRRCLTVLAQHGPCTLPKLAILAGYAKSGGSFKNAVGRCRSEGYVLPGPMPAITPKGAAALGPVDRLPRSPAKLREHWFAQLESRSRRILEAVIDAHPRQLMTTELAVRAGYPDHKGGSFKNGLGALRTLGLLSKGNPVRLAPELVG